MVKKLFVTFIAFTCLTAKAQEVLSVRPKYHVNDSVVYHNQSITSMNVAGESGDIILSLDMTIVVKEVKNNGYVVQLNTTNVETNYGQDSMLGEQMLMSMKSAENSKMLLEMDLDGRPLRILNFNEVAEQQKQYIRKLIEDVYLKYPQIQDALSKEQIINQMCEQISEKTQLKMLQVSSNPFAYNGKQFSLGATDTYLNLADLTMSRVVTRIDAKGGYVEMTAKDAATDEEIINMMFQRVKESVPSLANDEVIRTQIASMVEGGMMKTDFTENVAIQFFPNFYVKSITIDNVTSVMGQANKTRSTITCTYHSF